MLSAGELHRLVGRTLGWDVLHSSLYDVRKQGDVFLFEGRGRGHGVGLCQTGADARGRAGTSAAGILTAYFPGTSVRAWQWQRVAGERIEAEVADLGDAWVIEPAARALEEAERRSGRRAIGRIRLRVYPTVEDYRDHTGEPGFVLASSRRGLVRLQPPAKLRAQGVLPRVLLHEILHVLLTQNGERMPLWEEEGRVLLLTGERCAPASLNPNTERALASPRSEQELRTAYQNACAAAAGKLSSNNRR
jgi:stage II sporulation protein D